MGIRLWQAIFVASAIMIGSLQEALYSALYRRWNIHLFILHRLSSPPIILSRQRGDAAILAMTATPVQKTHAHRTAA